MNFKLVNAISIVFIMTSFNHIQCTGIGGDKSNSKSRNTDTVKKPSYVPGDASLIRFGSEQEPRFVWAEYAGPYHSGTRVYEHILAVRFFYNPTSVDTLFYENFDLRNGEKTFNPKDYKILYEQIDESTLTFANDHDTLNVFSVIHGATGRISNGVQMTNLPSVLKADDNRTYVAGSWITSWLKKDGKGQYSLMLDDGSKIHYRLNKDCQRDPEVMSFINVEDGRVYFIERDCWLDIVDTNDIGKLRNFH